MEITAEQINTNAELNNTFINIIEHLYNYAKSIYTTKITPSNVVMITTEIIQTVEKYNNLTGVQKKMIVINVVKKLVNSQNNTDEDKQAINLVIDLTLPTVIDGLISAINGDLKFDKEKVTSFFRKICCCAK